MEPPAAPNVSVYALAVAALNQSRRPALLVLSTGTLLSSTFQAGAVQAQAADVLAAVRAQGLPLAVLGCGIGSAQLQALLDAHRLGPFRSLVRCWAPPAVAACRPPAAGAAEPHTNAAPRRAQLRVRLAHCRLRAAPAPQACSSAPAAEAAPDLLAGLRQQAGAQFGDMLLLADDPALVGAAALPGWRAASHGTGLVAGQAWVLSLQCQLHCAPTAGRAGAGRQPCRAHSAAGAARADGRGSATGVSGRTCARWAGHQRCPGCVCMCRGERHVLCIDPRCCLAMPILRQAASV